MSKTIQMSRGASRCFFSSDRLFVVGLSVILLLSGCQQASVDSEIKSDPKPALADPQADPQDSADGPIDEQGKGEATAANAPIDELAKDQAVAVPQESPNDSQKQAATNGKPADDLSEPISLFNGKDLEEWEEIEFGGEGSIDVEDGTMTFEMGDPFTGICSTLEDLPKTNYEVSLQARKTQGVDFFCGLTFPVADSHCTLILGGWGGDVCGLSCIDDKDASTNDTSASILFKRDQWYKIRVRVQPEHISAWIDGKQIVDANIAGKKVSLRGDTTLCEPLGIASFQTKAQYKNIELRTIKVKEDAGK